MAAGHIEGLDTVGGFEHVVAPRLEHEARHLAHGVFVFDEQDGLGAARRRTRPWRAFLDDTADIHGLALVLLYALGVLLRDTHGITTDGVTYFAQLRSLVFDRDLDVAREFTVLGQPPRPNHVVPIGPTLLWAPLYLLVTLGDGLGRLAGLWRAPADAATLGLTTPYMRAALLSSFAVGGAGLVALLVFPVSYTHLTLPTNREV